MSTEDDAPRERERLVLVTVGLATCVVPLDTSVNVVFPAIIGAFGIDIPSIQWVVIAYVLTYSSLVLAFGGLADIFGHRRVLVAGLASSATALVLCAMAESFAGLIAARAAQGLGAAMILSVGPALSTLPFAASRRTRLLAGYLLAFGAAAAAGPLLGGALAAKWGWSAVFWFRVPIALLALALAFVALPARGRGSAAPFDLRGACGLSTGIAAVLIALAQGGRSGWLSLPAAIPLAVGCLCLAWFARHQLRVADPVLDLRVFRDARFTAANVAHTLVNAASFTVMLLVPFYLARSLGLGQAVSGLVLAVAPFGLLVAAPVAGRALQRTSGHAFGLLALTLAAAGLAGIATWPASASPWHLVGALFAQGFGHGLFQVALYDRVLATIPRRQHGVAGSLATLTRTIGVVTGATAGASLFAAFGGMREGEFPSAFATTFWVACSVVVLAIVVVASVRPRAPVRGTPDGACGQ